MEDSIYPAISKVRVSKYIIFNIAGIFIFFVPITFLGRNSITLDHISTLIVIILKDFIKIYIIAMMLIGVIYSLFIKKDFLKTSLTTFFVSAKIVGLIVGIMAVLKIGPNFIFPPDILPFLFDKLAIPLSIIIPLGGMFIVLITSYGFLEFTGVLMEKITRVIWKTPGQSSIDAASSLVGSYSIGLLITNKVYTEGKYTFKEAAIIATGFSTVSATFMVVVAKTLNLMNMWTFYFFTCLLTTFIVTAITVRVYPLRNMSNSYYINKKNEEIKLQGNILKRAIYAGLCSAENNKTPLYKLLLKNLKESFLIASGVVPSVLSVGLIGLLLAKYTPLFDYVGYIFFPFTKLLGFSEAMLTAKAVSTSIAEMFLPAILVTQTDLTTRYTVAVVAVSEILFFSASIPCILSTNIKIKIKDILIIWIERVILSLILARLIALIFIK